MDFHATVLQQGDGRNDRSGRSHGTPFHPQQASPGQRAFAHAAGSPSPGLSTAPGPPRHSSFVEGVMNGIGGAAIETERAGQQQVGSTARHSTNADAGSGSAGGGVFGGFHGQQHVGAIGDEALTWKAVGPKDANANELKTTNSANANVTVVRSPTKASTQQLLLQSDFHQPAPFHPQQHRPHLSPSSSSSPTTNSFSIPTHNQLPLHPSNAAPLISTPSSSASATITTRRPPPLLNYRDHHPPPAPAPPPQQHSFDPYAPSHRTSTLSSPSSPPYPTHNTGLPPLAPLPRASGSSITMASPGAKNGASPLQPPQADRHQTTTREKKSGSFYDPLTDTTTKERQPSDSWSNNKQSSRNDPYGTSFTQRPKSNGYGSPSPVNANFPARGRSPRSHSKTTNGTSADPPSPTNKALNLAASPSRHRTQPEAASTTSHQSSIPAASLPSILNPEPSASFITAAAPASTPSRAAELMSFSNILSSTDPLPKPARPPIMTEKREKPARKSKGREAQLRDSEGGGSKSKSRRSSSASRDPPVKSASKRQSNGQAKARTLSADKEKKIEKYLERLDAEADDIDLSELDMEHDYYVSRSKRRKLNLERAEAEDSKSRRVDLVSIMGRRLSNHAAHGKRRYEEIYFEEALQEVREREVFAEKERKKDMQRKRRREKSMQVTIEQREAALAKALATANETERQKLLREAERANKKVEATKMVLQKGIKGPARNLAPYEPNLEGGTMSSFIMGTSDAEPTSTKKSKRSGTRPKKSKEQKQAEKDSAEAAQAAIDAGEELPSREETKIRIKLNKGSSKESKDKDREGRDSTKEPKEKEKAIEEPPANPLETKFQSKGYNQIYDQIWRDLARKDVPKTFKLAGDSYATKASNLKKTAILASKEAKRWQLRTNKGTKDLQARAKRCMRDMMSFWKRNEREERDLRKAAERQEIENVRKEEADREAARQKRKLNFLISQTELYSHFIGKKIKTDEVERSTDNPEIAPAADADSAAHKVNVDEPTGPVGSKVTNFDNLTFEEEDEERLRQAAMANAQNAIAEAQKKARAFNNQDNDMDEDGEMNFQNPTGLGDVDIEQPKLLNCQLKEYQLKGLNWLANLYEQGINGILADEMGLGKTVQSISVMAYLAEQHDIWGPYLVVAPASTLHNWQQEIARFVPEFKILPYWGTAGDRKVLRKFWDRKHHTYKKDAPFHVLVTSYQLVVSDVAYFQKMKWQYMILDEAQAIKSSNSSRWKCLLSFHCRNRLLLTGTPIQNNMQELWALLHFIMPSLFDSHDEFSEWFSKDIESHAQSNTTLNEDQLKRLHMILKPFMLRRVKKHVQKELGDKIELDVFCDLTYRQRAYYRNLRNQISIMDLIEKATLGDDQDSGTLMNLVMQFRKVCNHPDLFERAETSSPFSTAYFAETASFVREGTNVAVGYSTRSLIEYNLPRLVWTDGGRLYKASEDNQRAGFRNKYLNHMLNIWTPENIRDSESGQDAFSFLRFADASPQEAYEASHADVFTRAAGLVRKENRLGLLNVVYNEPEEKNYAPAHALLQISARSDRRALAEVTNEGILDKLMNISRSRWRANGLSRVEQAALPGALAPPIEVTCEGTRTPISEREDTLFNVPMRRALYGPSNVEQKALVAQNVPIERYPPTAMIPRPDNEKTKFTNITVPSMRRFVTDSGKLAKLDQLLFKLKEEGHRVLLYFQMTRMIDLMEEYLTYRNYKYCRLDGSTKLEDRRDTVSDFQTRPEIFIFLLSTRAGGLGINLTSADTVIFYDSDWNPTIDSQAMDRAHRLGQTRQVTVYRLITRGTIEERIRKRAMQKEEVQRVVISGGGARGVDFSGRRPAENRNKDIAMWLADDEQAELIERREKELLENGEIEKQTKKRGGGAATKRKREAVSLDEMYHEGEGNFDDGNKQSGTATGTATPAEEAPAAPASKKRRGGGSKKAKTAKQRLALADGQME